MSRKPEKLCQSAYHAGFYCKHKRDIFPVLAIKDLDDSLMDNSKMVNVDPNQFEAVQDEDQMMVPFKCNTCQFMNVKKRLPIIGDAQDELQMVYLRQVILDSFWSRERSIVQGNLNLVQSLLVNREALGFES